VQRGQPLGQSACTLLVLLIVVILVHPFIIFCQPVLRNVPRELILVERRHRYLGRTFNPRTAISKAALSIGSAFFLSHHHRQLVNDLKKLETVVRVTQSYLQPANMR
jgi:hypothetical protein